MAVTRSSWPLFEDDGQFVGFEDAYSCRLLLDSRGRLIELDVFRLAAV
jgi:hypothetical protein